MSGTSGSSILRAIRLLYGTIFLLALACSLGGYYFWPGAIAWIFLALAALALAGGIAFAQLLARLRMILWLLPFLERWRRKDNPGSIEPGNETERGRPRR